MAEEAQGQQAPDELKAYFEQFEQRQAARDAQVNNQLGEMAQRQEQLAQYVTSSAPKAPPMPAGDNKLGEKILEEFFRDPPRFLAEWNEMQNRQSEQREDEKIQAFEARMREQQAYESFWAQFSAANPDVAGFTLPLVKMAFDQTPGTDATARADQAAARVRAELASRAGQSAEAEQGQQAAARMTATAGGGRTDPASVPARPEAEMSDRELHESGFNDLMEFQSKRSVYG